MELEKQLNKTGEEQVSITDPEARQLMIRGLITEVAYNAHITVDSKHNPVIDTLAINTNDRKILSTMLSRAKEIVMKESIMRNINQQKKLNKCDTKI